MIRFRDQLPWLLSESFTHPSVFLSKCAKNFHFETSNPCFACNHLSENHESGDYAENCQLKLNILRVANNLKIGSFHYKLIFHISKVDLCGDERLRRLWCIRGFKHTQGQNRFCIPCI